jgi:hypothetical protein
MGTNAKNRAAWLAIVCLSGVFSLDAAVAAPPNSTQSIAHGSAVAQGLGFGAQHSFATQHHFAAPNFAAPLDLRPPSHAIESNNNAAAFPSAALHRPLGAMQERAQLPTLGSDAARVRPPLEVLAQRIHREGVPVARLWENKSALLHIGLNQRGKPGLWLVQKTH